MVVTAVQPPSPSNVVFLVEATSNLEPSFNEIKSKYIGQILNYFNPAFGDDSDMVIDSSNNLYSLVSFTSVDASPHPSVTCTQPTSNTHEIQDAFGFIQFTQNWNFGVSHVTEALAMSLQVLDECKKFRAKTSVVAENHVILICNSLPYDVATRETRAYLGLSATELVDKIAERGAHFSVISPRRRPKLFQLFKRVSKPTLPLTNYAVDAKHHVLIDSIAMKEQPKVEKVVRSIIEIDNSPVTETNPVVPTSASHSILVDQLKDAHNQMKDVQRTNTSFAQVSTAAPTKVSQTVAGNNRSQDTPLLTEILASTSAGGLNNDPSQNQRTFITVPGPHTSTIATNAMGQTTMSDSQYKNSQMQAKIQSINQNQSATGNQIIGQPMKTTQMMANTPMSMSNNPQSNQQIINNPMSMGNNQQSNPSMMSHQMSSQPMNSQMVNNALSMANTQQSNTQMINNNPQLSTQQVTGSLQGINPTISQAGLNQMNTTGVRQQITANQNRTLQGAQPNQPGAQFTRSVNPNQMSQQFNQQHNQMQQLPQTQGLMQQQQQQQQQQLQIGQQNTMQPNNMQSNTLQQNAMQPNPMQANSNLQQIQQMQQQQQQQQQQQANRALMQTQQQQQNKMVQMNPQGHMLQKQPSQPPYNMLQPTQQYQVVWQGTLEFNERRSGSLGQQPDRPIHIPAKLMADVNTEGDLIANGGLFNWPTKISIYPIPEQILSQSLECKRQLQQDTRKLTVLADTGPNSPFRTFVNMLIDKNMSGVVNMNALNEYKIMVLLPDKSRAATNNIPALKALLPRQQSLFYDEFKKSVHLFKEKTKAQQNAANRNVPRAPNTMAGQMPMGGPNQMGSGMQGMNQMNMQQRIPNPSVQRQMNPNMQPVMMGSNQVQQQQMSGMMGGQINQQGMQQQNNMQQQQQGQQMNNMGNQQLMNPLMSVQRPIQNTQIMMRPQMMNQHIVQQRMNSQQQGQQMMMQQQQQSNKQPMMMGAGNQPSNMPVQQGQQMGGNMDDLFG